MCLAPVRGDKNSWILPVCQAAFCLNLETQCCSYPGDQHYLAGCSLASYDLDLVLKLNDLARAVELLQNSVFGVTEEELGRVVLEHAEHGRVDLHPVTFDAHGNGVQVQPAEIPLVYRGDGFVSGLILGRAVPCISADVQVFARLGYDRSEKHRGDAIALCSAFGLQIPGYWEDV